MIDRSESSAMTRCWHFMRSGGAQFGQGRQPQKGRPDTSSAPKLRVPATSGNDEATVPAGIRNSPAATPNQIQTINLSHRERVDPDRVHQLLIDQEIAVCSTLHADHRRRVPLIATAKKT